MVWLVVLLCDGLGLAGLLCAARVEFLPLFGHSRHPFAVVYCGSDGHAANARPKSTTLRSLAAVPDLDRSLARSDRYRLRAKSSPAPQGLTLHGRGGARASGLYPPVAAIAPAADSHS